MRPVHPPRLVQVRVDDTWHQGFLEAWRRDGNGLWGTSDTSPHRERRLTSLPPSGVRRVCGASNRKRRTACLCGPAGACALRMPAKSAKVKLSREEEGHRA